ncbi:MAG: hypothetical protein WC852_03005 [Candidatus Nanoarchaeia archaeon]
MKKWQEFELNAAKYLQSAVNMRHISFKASGGSDSTTSDIKVNFDKDFDKKLLFNIEAKLMPAQAGQFVVLFNEGKFEYSSNNKDSLNEFSQKIIAHMNKHIEYYSNCGTAGSELKCDNNLFLNWILAHYNSKKARFIITSKKPNSFDRSFIKICPLSAFANNFEIKAIYRIKKSGSVHMPKKDLEEVKRLLTAKFKNMFSIDDKGQVKFSSINPNKQKIGDKFYLSSEEGLFKITKLSSTKNANVIFSLSFIGEASNSGLSELKDEIQKEISA